MKIGSLGDIVFEVSDETIQSVGSMELSGSANISTHALRLRKGQPEFTGTAPEQLTLAVRVTKLLGADPEAVIDKIKGYMNIGTALRLQFANKTFGSAKWLIAKYRAVVRDYDAKGGVADAEITLTLTEYPKE